MGTKQIDITCPCCQTRLTVDVLTRQILRQAGPAEAGAAEGPLDASRWDKARDHVVTRTQSGEDKLDQALAKEQGKEARLDELFRKATKKLSKEGEDGR